MDYKSYKIIETKCKHSIKNNQKAEGKSMKNQRTKCKGIKSKWIAWKLRKEGFQIATVEPDWHNPEKDIYVFEMVPGFQEALDRILEERQQNKIKYKKDK